MAKVALGVGPFVPDAHTMLLQVVYIGVATQEPQQLVNDGLEVQLFGGEQRKALFKVKAHLMAKDALCASAGAVAFYHTVVEYML